MSLVNITNVQVLDNPSLLISPFRFEITFECINLEWKIIYVGSANTEQHDQVLESILVGPVPVGVNKFVFEAPPPDVKLIPPHELLGVTVVLLTCAYREQEFIRIGYYCAVDYLRFEELRENPPLIPEFDKIDRFLLSEKPKVTRYPIAWDNEQQNPSDVTMEAASQQMQLETQQSNMSLEQQQPSFNMNWENN